eukprot:321083_1
MIYCIWLTLLAMFIGQSLSQCTFTVLSNDHSHGATGQYFNYDTATVDRILGRTDWHHTVLRVRVINTGAVRDAMMWRTANGGSIGSGHGRKDSGSAGGDWNVNDVLEFVDIPCHCIAVGFTFSPKHNCECKDTCEGEFCNSIDDVKGALGGSEAGYCETGQCCCSCGSCVPFNEYPQ